MQTDADTLAALRRLLPAGTLVEDKDVIAAYEQDILGRFPGSAQAVARPTDTAGVAAVVGACAEVGQPLVPQGGATGLVGGAVPTDGELVLSLRGLDRVGEVDHDANQLDVGAGVTLEAAQAAARAAGLELPIDHPARASATIGGMVATNAGGALARRHGTMRRRVVGVEVVLADGAVVSRMAGLLKDNAGYDLPALLIGSEGTLGVITAVRLQLEPASSFRIAALFGVVDLRAGLDLLRTLRGVPGLEAADFFDADCMRLVRDHRELRDPLGREHGFYLIAQCAADEDVTEQLATAAEIAGDPDVVAASDSRGREELWAYRELLNEAIRAVGVPHKLDIALPLAAIPPFDREIRRRLADRFPEARLYIYGHLGDGNLHVNVVGPDPADDGVDELVLRCTAEYGGTISAEHGIGRAKRRYLSLCRSAADIAAMTALKRALDPAGLLAPGRVLPDEDER
jgi:FAD/FMN-containing dehydrogenase